MAKIVCPHCGYDGKGQARHSSQDNFQYLEDAVTYRSVLHGHGFKEWAEDEVLQVDGLYHVYDEGNETNPRFLCMNCLGEFPVPDDLELDFI
jgi:hypothetical protein